LSTLCPLRLFLPGTCRAPAPPRLRHFATLPAHSTPYLSTARTCRTCHFWGHSRPSWFCWTLAAIAHTTALFRSVQLSVTAYLPHIRPCLLHRAPACRTTPRATRTSPPSFRYVPTTTFWFGAAGRFGYRTPSVTQPCRVTNHATPPSHMPCRTPPMPPPCLYHLHAHAQATPGCTAAAWDPCHHTRSTHIPAHTPAVTGSQNTFSTPESLIFAARTAPRARNSQLSMY